MFWVLISLLHADDEILPLYRVDVPNYPGALSSSEHGSMLSTPPTDGTPWRWAAIGQPDAIVPTGDIVAWEALEAMGIPRWHDAGYDGSGVKIAVLDVQWYGTDIDDVELGMMETHDCFVHPSCEQPIDTIRPTFSFETGAHGLACAEVIRDIAPGATLHLVRVSGLTTMENAVAWAIREDIDIISMSLSFFNESFYDGTGDINGLLNQLTAAGILMVTSAGNYADQHHRDTFTDRNQDGFHDFTEPEGLSVYLPQGRSTMYLLWDQFRSCGRTDLDMYVMNTQGDVVGWSADGQSIDQDSCFPGERLSAYAEEEGWYYINIKHAGGAADARFDVHTRRGSLLEPVVEGSITDPGTSPLALTVGAVRATQYTTADVESFSSQGPTNGGLAKPDLAGPNGLSTSVYGPTGFYGTSASTPAVVGALALVMSREPNIDSLTAAQRLRSWALRIDGAPTWAPANSGEGAGRAHLPDPDLLDGGCLGRQQALVALPLAWIIAGMRRRHKR